MKMTGDSSGTNTRGISAAPVFCHASKRDGLPASPSRIGTWPYIDNIYSLLLVERMIDKYDF